MFLRALPQLFRKAPKTTVMVVCMENLCRSPLASELLNAVFALQGVDKHFRAESAGISVAIPGRKADPRVIKLMQEKGLRVPKGRSRQISPKMIAQSDLVLAVDHQVQQLLQEKLGVRAPLLMEFALLSSRHQTLDVPDPYYTNQQGFERVYDLIEEAAIGVSEHLQSKVSTR
jgi:protein-tyrosine phosphatase